MSVPEFKYAAYSGNVWSECVELDEGECVFLSVLKCFNYVFFMLNCCFVFVLFLYSISRLVSKLSFFQHSASK